MDSGGEAKGAPDPADDIDARTIFVRSLPFALTDSQLEDYFSDVGPVRHCFTVKEKGSDQHRGFGFVQFAVTEDAHRAAQEKNGALLQGRKIKVEVAKRRAPLDVRLPKNDLSNPVEEKHPTTVDEKQLSKSDTRKRKSKELQSGPSVRGTDGERHETKKKPKHAGEKANEEQKEIRKKKITGDKLDLEAKTDQKRESDEAQGSSKQRPARTVVVGGLASTTMLEAVLDEAKKAGPIESIQKTFSELELSSRGLAKDGCKAGAAAIVFLSVKAARQAVATLHQKTIAGGVVWARQLGGEGSKLKQLRVIVRNLPFQVTEATLRELFSPAGFLWEVTVPRKPNGLSKGFAFIGFTSKADAEKAIKLVNGKLVAKRPVAVDWAVAKKQFEAAVAPVTPAIGPDVDLDESESTASESESDDKSVGDASDSENDEKTGASSGSIQGHVVVGKKPTSDDRMLKQKKQGQEGLIAEKDAEKIDGKLKKSGYIAEDSKYGHLEKMGRKEEIDMVKTILAKVVTSVPDHPSDDEEVVEALASERPDKKLLLKSLVAKDQSTKKLTPNGKTSDVLMKVEGTELAENETDGEESKLSRTVFIRNLPAEAKVPELRKLFSEFGEVKSFRLVLHPVTKRSKGNAFLEYAKQEAAQAAVAAAAKSGADDVGLMLKGRAVTVSMAVDKDSARKIAKETFHKQVEEDKRNLVLAKEGQILVGTPAAEGVSKKDMAKRQQLEHEKSTKLRSPNFHVSRIRLLVHNIPKSMAEKELKKLFLEGVKSRASKQNPVVKQVKILRDEDSQKSRGAAFVEFTEHQHALVALRVLNNNPATFGAENRPIVEFAIENSLILRKRAANADKAKNWQSKGAQGKKTRDRDTNVGEGKTVDVVKKQKVRRGEEPFASRGDNKRVPENGRPPVNEDQTSVKEDRKRKRGKERHEARKTLKDVQGGVHGTASESSPHSALPNGEKLESKAGRKIKRGKTSGADRKAAQARRESSDVTGGAAEPSGESSQLRPNSQKLGTRGVKRIDQKSKKVESVEQPNLSKQRMPQKESESKSSSRLQSKGSNRETRVKSKKQRSGAKGGDTEDKLDKLAAEYRTKYFSGVSKPTAAKGVSLASGDLRRWFE